MRQYAGFATAEETNRGSATCSSRARPGLSVAFDLPTQMGYDSDAPEAAGEVGRVGVPISTPRRHGDPARRPAARRGQHLDDDQRHGADPARPLRRRRRAPGRAARPDLGHDPERHPQGVHRPRDVDLPAAAVDAPRDRHLRVLRAGAAALEHDLDQRLPHARGGGDGRPGARVHARRRDRLLRGGRRARARDRRRSRRASRFFFAAWSELFEEVAKFRAARRMWARIVRDRFGATNARSMACRFHVQTAGSSLTAQSIDNNVVRTTVQALAGRARRRPEPPHERPRRGARPADRGGAPASPSGPSRSSPTRAASPRRPTRSPARTSSRRLTDAARGGGPGLPRRDRRDGRHARRDRGRLPAAPDPGVGLPRPAGDRARATWSSSGVNKFRDDAAASAAPPLQRIDPEGERRQIERVRRVRAERDPGRVGGGARPARGRRARRRTTSCRR